MRASVWTLALVLLACPAEAALQERPRDDKQAAAPDASAAAVPPLPPAALTGHAGIDVNVIHAADKLVIEVYHEQELSGTFTVDASGKINYPLLGEIFVEGLTLDELKSYLTENLGADYIVNPQISITYAESPNKSVAVLGQVAKPGNYILTPNTTLVRLISQVGGFTAEASLTNVKIVRTDERGKMLSRIIDVNAIMSGGADDEKLEPGDLIYVERMAPRVEEKIQAEEPLCTVLGQVSRPGNYIHTKKTTLIRLIAQAGGFTPLAATNRVRVVRTPAEGEGVEQVFHVDAGRIMAGRADDIEVRPGDLVVVEETLF